MRMAENNTNVNGQAVSPEQAQRIVQQVLGSLGTLLPGLTSVVGGIAERATGLIPSSGDIANLVPSAENISAVVPTVNFTNTGGVLNLEIDGTTLLNLDLASLIPPPPNGETPAEPPAPAE